MQSNLITASNPNGFGDALAASSCDPRRCSWLPNSNPARIGDFVGRKYNTLHLEYLIIEPFKMFEMILLKRFEKLPGHKKVSRGEYAIEESLSGTDVNRSRDWNLCFRPGQKVDMSIFFHDTAAPGNSCPRCGTLSGVSTEVRTQW